MLVVRRANKNSFEVLDRLSRHAAGLSDAQKNDFQWWKEAWDGAMVTTHGVNWADMLAGWVQNLLGATESNAFSKFKSTTLIKVEAMLQA